MDSMIRLFPFALIFFATMGAGTWYFMDTEATTAQVKQWLNMEEVAAEESGVAMTETSATVSEDEE